MIFKCFFCLTQDNSSNSIRCIRSDSYTHNAKDVPHSTLFHKARIRKGNPHLCQSKHRALLFSFETPGFQLNLLILKAWTDARAKKLARYALSDIFIDLYSILCRNSYNIMMYTVPVLFSTFRATLRMGWRPSFYTGASGACMGNSGDCAHASGMPQQNIGITPPGVGFTLRQNNGL